MQLPWMMGPRVRVPPGVPLLTAALCCFILPGKLLHLPTPIGLPSPSAYHLLLPPERKKLSLEFQSETPQGGVWLAPGRGWAAVWGLNGTKNAPGPDFGPAERPRPPPCCRPGFLLSYHLKPSPCLSCIPVSSLPGPGLHWPLLGSLGLSSRVLSPPLLWFLAAHLVWGSLSFTFVDSAQTGWRLATSVAELSWAQGSFLPLSPHSPRH